MMDEWPWHVRIYAPANKGGHLLLETKHQTQASYIVEISAALARNKRGEVGRIELLSFGRTETVAP